MEKKKPIVILGAGESGVGAAILAQQQGYDVFVSDARLIDPFYKEELIQYGIAYEENGHTEAKIMETEALIKSPGISDEVPIIQQAIKKNIAILSEIEFASRYTHAKMICITGTNGKSTTTMLTYYILQQAGLHVGLAGNIGKSFARQVATQNFDYYVLEISSFMLDNMYQFKADIAVLLNITPDHLDRYNYQLTKYVASKFRIIQNQGSKDSFIYCADDLEIMNILQNIRLKPMSYSFSIKKKENVAAYLENNEMNINLPSINQTPFNMSITELALQGKHNIYNSMASGIVAKILQLRNESIRSSMESFENIEHRLEHVASISGVHFINDSKATNVNSTWYALESTTNPVILILGGVDKGNDYNMLKELVKSKVRGIICLGKNNKAIHDAFENEVDLIINTTSAKEAVLMAYHLAKKGDTVLLSPACSSFDLFENYKDRGNQFKKAVKEL